MKKALFAAAFCFIVLGFALPVQAQEKSVFLSLTRYAQDMDKLPVSVEVIDSKEIEAGHYETISEVLAEKAGIEVKSYGSSGQQTSVFIRGAHAAGTLLLIDGRRTNGINIGAPDFAVIPLNIIDRIEIIRGAGASIYGTNAIGGVINIITKKATETSPILELGYSFGEYNTNNPYMTAAFNGEEVSLLVSGAYLDSNGLKEPINNTHHDYTNVFYSLQWRPSSKSEFSLTGDYHYSEVGTPGNMYSDPPPLHDNQKDENQYVKLDYKLFVSEKSYVKLSGYQVHNVLKINTDYNGISYASDEFVDSYNQYVSKTLGFQADFNLDNFILVGVETKNDNLKHTDVYGDPAGRDVFEKSSYVDSAYAQMNVDFWKFTFIPSVRGDKNNDWGNVATPAMAVIFNADETLRFSVNGGKLWRAPAFSDMYDIAYADPITWETKYRNIKTEPEQGISYDFGVELTLEKLRLIGTFFTMDIDKKIQWAPLADDPDTWAPQNIQKAKQQGFEFEAGFIMFPWLSHSLNYTYTQATDESDTVREADYSTWPTGYKEKPNKFKGEQLIYVPKHKASYTLTVRPIKGLSAAATVSYTGEVNTENFFKESYKEDDGDRKLPAVCLLDIALNYNLNKNTTLWFKALNVANAKYQSSFSYPAARRSLYAGVTLKLWK